MKIIRRHISIVLLICAAHVSPALSAENWPGQPFFWPRWEWSMGARCPLDHFRKGSTLTVPFGGYFFPNRTELNRFVAERYAVQLGVRLLRPGHSLVALEDIDSEGGRVHDQQYGDGFVALAPCWGDLFKRPPLPFIRRARNMHPMVIEKDF